MNSELAWKATLGELELQMTKATFNTWLKDARLVSSEEDKYIVGVRNDYAKDWLESRLSDTITRTLSTIAGKQVGVSFVVHKDEPVNQAPVANGVARKIQTGPLAPVETPQPMNGR
ncbi:MAG: DnaA N-terminal domain-containing protein, partial [Chloroflexota bacterium]